MASNDEIVKLIIEGENLLSEDVDSAIKDLEKLSKESKQAAKELKELNTANEAAKSFQKLSKSIDDTEDDLVQLKTKLSEARQELKETGKDAGQGLRSNIAKLETQIKGLNSDLTAQRSEFRKTSKTLEQYGIDTKEVGEATKKLAADIDKAEIQQKQLGERYKATKVEIEKSVGVIKKERSERLALIETMDIDEKQRKVLSEITEKQYIATRRIGDLLDEENISRRKIINTIKNEGDARKRSLQTYQKLTKEQVAAEEELAFAQAEKVSRQKQEEVQLENTAAALLEFRVQLKLLAKEYKDGKVSSEEYEDQVEDLRKELKLSEGEINKVRRAIEKDAQAKKQAAIASEKKAEADNKEKESTEKLNNALVEYRVELRKLVAAKKAGEITTEEYAIAEAKLARSKKLSAQQTKITRLEEEQLGAARKKSLSSTDLLTTATRRLAQVYTVLLAAQKSTQAVIQNVTAYSDLERAITGVEKTTNDSRLAMQELARELEEISETISGSATTDLLKYAEAAGQMGIKGKEALLEMAEAADTLAVSTDLAGEDAVKALSRILNVTGEGTQAIRNVSSALVDLGNNYALTESELLHFSKEVASGTANVNTSSASILGLSSAMLTLGQRPERVKSAFSRAFSAIEDAIKGGGQQLEDLQQITGLTVEQLEQGLGKDTEQVLIAFAEGLRRISTEGGTVANELKKFNITSTETKDVLTLVGKRADYVREAVRKSGEAYKEANKHTEEAVKFWALQEQEIKRVSNQFNNLKAAIGSALGDETQQGLEMFSELLEQVESGAIQVFDVITDIALGIPELLGSLTDFGEEIADVFGGNLSLFERITAQVKLMVNVVSVAARSMALAAAKLKLSVAEAFDSDDIEKYQKRVAEITSQMHTDFDDLGSAARILKGESSSAFEDLISTADRYKDSIGRLSKEQQEQLQTILLTKEYNQESEEAYLSLTEALVAAYRQTKLLAEIEERKNKSKVGHIEVIKEEAEANEQVAKSTERVTESLEEISASIDRVDRNFAEGLITQEQYNEAMERLKGKLEAVKSVNGELATSQEQQLEAFERSSSASKKLEISLLEQRIALGEMNAALNKVVDDEERSYRLKLKISQANENLAKTERELAITRELESKTLFQLKTLQEQHNLELEKLDDRMVAGTITAGEYRKEKEALAFTTTALNVLIGEEGEKFEQSADSTNKATDALKQLKEAQNSITSGVKDTTNALDKNNEALAENAQRAGASQALTNLWLAKNKELHKELDYTSLSVDELTKELFDLNVEMHKFEKATAKATYDAIGILKPIDDMTRKVNQRKKAILEETITLKQWIEQVESGTTSLSYLGKMADAVDRHFSHLSDNQLEPLRAAIADAKAEFQDLTDVINDSFDDVQDRLDALLGKEEDIIKRKFSREMDELLGLLDQAQNSGDRVLIDKINQAITNLKRAQQLELKEFKADTSIKPLSPDGQLRSTSHNVTINLPNNTTTSIAVASQADASALIDALSSLGDVNLNGVG